MCLFGGRPMSGHSKWSTIKHKKAKTDAQRGKQFSKVGREIMMAAKLGGEDPLMNPRLRLALQKAKEANMPNDNIKRAIIKGAGSGDESNFEDMLYEAYGPNGVAILIEAMTDNRNRTVSNIKATLVRGGGSMASVGAVSYLFSQKGLLVFEPGVSDEETLMTLALEADAEDVVTNDEGYTEVICSIQQFEAVKKQFDDKSIEYMTARLTRLPATTVSLSEEQTAKMEQFIEKLEEDDDVQDVYTNVEGAA